MPERETAELDHRSTGRLFPESCHNAVMVVTFFFDDDGGKTQAKADMYSHVLSVILCDL